VIFHWINCSTLALWQQVLAVLFELLEEKGLLDVAELGAVLCSGRFLLLSLLPESVDFVLSFNL
jgi:hypothetical protein